MKFELSPEESAVIKKYAERKGLKPEEGLSKMLRFAVSRINALEKYAKKGEGAAPKKAAKKVAKKAKAKGPLARKAKAAAEVQAQA